MHEKDGSFFLLASLYFLLLRLKPTVLWAQRSDTVILTVSLTDIKKEKISLEDSVFKFSGCGGSEGKFYDVELKFYGDVVPQVSFLAHKH